MSPGSGGPVFFLFTSRVSPLSDAPCLRIISCLEVNVSGLSVIANIRQARKQRPLAPYFTAVIRATPAAHGIDIAAACLVGWLIHGSYSNRPTELRNYRNTGIGTRPPDREYDPRVGLCYEHRTEHILSDRVELASPALTLSNPSWTIYKPRLVCNMNIERILFYRTEWYFVSPPQNLASSETEKVQTKSE